MRGIALAVGIAIVALVGCGGEKAVPGAATTTEDAVTRHEFIATAEEVCDDFDARVDQLERQFDELYDEGKYAAAASVLEEGQETVEEGIDELESLPRPPEDEELLDVFFEKWSTRTTLFGQTAEALRDRDAAQLQSLRDSVAALDAEIRGIAKGYGFEECGGLGAGNGRESSEAI